MGEVYLVEDSKLDRKVALKILPTDFAEDAERMSRFIREAKSASALNHPNILTIYEVGESAGTHYIATEFIEGAMLRERMQGEELPIEEALDIAVQIASALSVAHEARITHRDIKPENIMIRRDGLVKVLDFGIAKQRVSGGVEIDSEGETKIQFQTKAGKILGTTAYMSPEQTRGKETDARTDIWSFGCILYEMLTRHQPFHGETTADVLANIIYREPESIFTHREDTPSELERIITKTLSKNKDERYQSTKELFDDLKELQTQVLVDAVLVRHPEMRNIIQSSSVLNSIAVLPFANISAEKDNEYFSEGLTEEIIMNLSKMQMLRVVPRGSTMHYVKEGKTYKQAADELGVQYLLDGGVRRHGKDLRITAQLIDTDHDSYLWSETYRGTIEDIFEIQENVATEIVQALQVRLSPDEKQNLKKRFTENTEAYQLYLQGRFFWNKRSEEGIKTAIKYFEKAIEKDERYALAWAGIADSYSMLGEYGNIQRKKLFPKAEAAVKKALELDDELAEVHTSLASLLMLNKWDWANSEKEFKLALELNPNYATTHHWYSQWFLAMGRLEEALRMITRATELDPVSQAILKDRGLVLYFTRRYDDAIEMARKTLELDPNYSAAHRLLSLSYQGKEQFDEAIEENRKWGNLTGNRIDTNISLAQLYAVSGKREEAKQLVKVLEKENHTVSNVYRGLALVYAALGEDDTTFELLEKSYNMREESLLNLKVDPKMERLASDPRFIALLRKIGVEN
jgi:serine/threonine protein kinase/Flp pilus assembly protein TadD